MTYLECLEIMIVDQSCANVICNNCPFNNIDDFGCRLDYESTLVRKQGSVDNLSHWEIHRIKDEIETLKACGQFDIDNISTTGNSNCD